MTSSITLSTVSSAKIYELRAFCTANGIQPEGDKRRKATYQLAITIYLVTKKQEAVEEDWGLEQCADCGYYKAEDVDYFDAEEGQFYAKQGATPVYKNTHDYELAREMAVAA